MVVTQDVMAGTLLLRERACASSVIHPKLKPLADMAIQKTAELVLGMICTPGAIACCFRCHPRSSDDLAFVEQFRYAHCPF